MPDEYKIFDTLCVVLDKKLKIRSTRGGSKGRQERAPPPSVLIHFHAVFSKSSAKANRLAPLLGISAYPLGIPGSATVNRFLSFEFLMYIP